MLYISQLLETNKIEELVEKYPIGLEVISFSIGYILDDVEQSIAKYEKEFKQIKGKVDLTFHGPFLDLFPGSCDTRVSALAMERFEEGYKAAKAFGATQMVFHTGYIPDTYPDVYWLENTIKFWREFLEGKIEHTTFYVENVLDRDYKLIKQLVEAIDHPHFKICLDIGHVHAYSNIPLKEWIEALGEHIGYVHLHNNDGTRDEHRGLLQGTIPIEEIIGLLKEKAPKAHWSLEVSNEEELVESIEWLVGKNL